MGNEVLRQTTVRVTTVPAIDITSRPSASGEFTEALLFIDEPTPALQRPCSAAALAPFSGSPGRAGDPGRLRRARWFANG
ncbi:MAG: hypothetical protein R2729_30555 [Bryobacteraceae bacterium]